MYAVIRLGGHQYRVESGNILDVERLPHEIGTEITIEDVLLVGDGDNTVIGTPVVEGAAVKATVADQFRGKKLLIIKFHPSTVYRRRRGHRHYHTRLKIGDIVVK